MAKNDDSRDFTIGLGGGLRIGFRKEATCENRLMPAPPERVDGQSFLGIAWTKTYPERTFNKTANWYLGVFRRDIIAP